jgi:hypothetical protein
MTQIEIDPKIAHRISEPLHGVTYSFSPDGRVAVKTTGKEHMYFSRSRRVGRDVGYMELRGAELYEYQARFRKIVLRAAA